MEIAEKIKQRNEKFYTEKGIKALENRLKSWIGLFNKNEFPVKSKMIGFGNFIILNKEDCFSRIKELLEITGKKIKVRREVVKYLEREIIKEEIIYG